MAARRSGISLTWASALLLAAAAGCAPVSQGDAEDGQVPSPEELEQEEIRLIREFTNRLPPDTERRQERLFGTDPSRIRYLPDLDRYLILLRNSHQVLLCDPDLKVLDRQPTPASPAAWDVGPGRRLYVGGEQTSRIEVFQVEADRIRSLRSLDPPDVVSVTDLALVEEWNVLFLLDSFERRLVRLKLDGGVSAASDARPSALGFPIGAGPLRIVQLAQHLIVLSLLEHQLIVLPLEQGFPNFEKASRIGNDGPFWSLAAMEREGDLLIAAGGIENRPLDRTQGEFGYIDSFLYLFRLKKDQGAYRWQESMRGDPSAFQQFNLSEINVVMPKAVVFQTHSKDEVGLWVGGFGAESLAEFRLDGLRPRLRRKLDSAPGISDIALAPSEDSDSHSLALANPLTDRVEIRDPMQESPVAVLKPDPTQSRLATAESRLGEALFFTTLLTPDNSSEGQLSRFTCEGCHWEGTIDGRVHFTGREDIHASTKPLNGMAHNLPLFSRGGDRSLSTMVLAEFRVANQGRRDVFEVDADQHPWLEWPTDREPTIGPDLLRRAFLAFFVDFDHRPNPWRSGRPELDPLALRGLDVFQQRCQDCHQALRSTRGEEHIPRNQWPQRLAGRGDDPLWAAPFFSRTGVEPYVDEAGARVPSLRRVWLKYPYFTNGSSLTLRDLLLRFRFNGSSAWHHLEKPEGGIQKLTPSEVEALEAALRYF